MILYIVELIVCLSNLFKIKKFFNIDFFYDVKYITNFYHGLNCMVVS